jgi:hypothetical protein
MRAADGRAVRTRRKLPQGRPEKQGKDAILIAVSHGDNDRLTPMDQNGTKSSKSGSRDKRLAAALRENLRRRKAQERARSEAPASGTGAKPDQAGEDDESR